MTDIHELIDRILSDKKLQPEPGAAKIYHDEPILKTAVQMKNYLPPKYREMREISRNSGFSYMADAKLFYTQGKFMEDFEDDFEYYGEFIHYFPTYQTMNDLQLRGYFSWRAKVRHGNIQPTSLSFAFVYVYELINGIGVRSPGEGFHTLCRFREEYRKIDPYIDRYIKPWLLDYIVYYGLDVSLAAGLSDSAFDDALLILLNREAHTADEVFTALGSLSSYNPEKSKFFKEYPDDANAVICRVFDRLDEYFRANRKNSLFDRLFGRCVECPYHIFNSAVFYSRISHDDYEYRINDIHIYRCKNGRWSCKMHYGNRGKSKELGLIFKTADRLMREKYGFKNLLKPEKTTKLLCSMIEKEIELYRQEKQKNSAPKIEIDLSKLAGIRRAAVITRDRLIVEEPDEGTDIFTAESAEPTNEAVIAPEAETVPGTAVEPPADAFENDAGLDETEYRFLQALLSDKPYHELLREKHVMLSVAVDSVNEKLFDRFGDTVIVFEGDVPCLLDDYKDELKGIIRT